MGKKIKYCVGLNGAPGNLETLLAERGNDIHEVYAAAPRSISPAGRRVEFPLDLRSLKKQVALAHAHGVRYNVVMNASCFGGMEFSPSFRRRISDFTAFLDDIGADTTTIANPYVIELVRSRSKRIEIVAGSFAEVVEPVKIARLRARGADRIVLHQNVYRNFEMLKALRAAADCPLEIIPNQGCLNQCDGFISHVNLVAHSSTPSDARIKRYGDFNHPIKRCRLVRQTDPVEFLMSCFIRPEDLGIYETLGFDHFKFAGRNGVSTEWMLNVLDAYISRSYEGNAFDLSSHVGATKKLCRLPNKALDGWYRYMGSNADSLRFRKKARRFSRLKRLDRYFPRRSAVESPAVRA